MNKIAALLGLLLICFSCQGFEKQQSEKPDVDGGTKDLKVMTFNIWQEGTMVENGLDKIRDIIIEADPDLVGFTEVRNYEGEDWTSKIVKKLADKGSHYSGMFAGGDVSLISKFPITASHLIFDGEGSVVRFNVKVDSQTIVVAVAHLDYTGYACYLPRAYYGGTPNWNFIKDRKGNKAPITDVDAIMAYNQKSTREAQIQAFLNAVKDETNPVILMGDFNEPSHLDWTEKAAQRFDHNGVVIKWPSTYALYQNGFTDAYREFHPDELTHPGITWPSKAHGKGSTSWTPLSDERDRIDYIFYKGNGIKTTFATLVGPKESYAFDELTTTHTSGDHFLADTLAWPSDHKAVQVTLRFK
ncbi:endonuclease/exonuclease/phosphatase family protein [Gelidibacter maritimus]|uniref:Endonuclease/exonuclease/phosphatase family protein n=1 Tax=Gelidibacter maritimus TaxID=2761487 RepID=A0A7W2M4Z3_9FLAO|nr:endonuclease/exonuclease/phosphatase family protein [Gelidibacter maritimus]MBA6152809.1 endonuclease/exonuclease/phosphatase family protein [Gelidibacter maritimus]